MGLGIGTCLFNKETTSNVIVFIPINDDPTWFSQETATTERGRFFLSRHKLSLQLTDTKYEKEQEFPFLFSLYQWFEEQYGYEVLFAQLVERQ